MNVLQQLRSKRKLTQKQVADAINVHVSMISNWETGAKRPNAKNAYALAKFYKVKMERILK